MEMIQQIWRPTQKSIKFSQHSDDSDTDDPETTLSYAKLPCLLQVFYKSPGCLLVDGYRDREDPRTPKHSHQQKPSSEEGCLTTNRVWIYLETECISQGEVPRNEKNVRKWNCCPAVPPRTGLCDIRLPGFPTFRLSCTPHGNCNSPSKRT